MNPMQETQVRVLFNQAQHPSTDPVWRRAYCGESHELQFAQCWRYSKNHENVA